MGSKIGAVIDELRELIDDEFEAEKGARRKAQQQVLDLQAKIDLFIGQENAGPSPLVEGEKLRKRLELAIMSCEAHISSIQERARIECHDARTSAGQELRYQKRRLEDLKLILDPQYKKPGTQEALPT